MPLPLLAQLGLDGLLPVSDPLRLPQQQPGVPGGDQHQREVTPPLLNTQVFYLTQSYLNCKSFCKHSIKLLKLTLLTKVPISDNLEVDFLKM